MASMVRWVEQGLTLLADPGMMRPTMNLRGKTVLITGAAKRLGREIALTLAGRGADIVVHYSRSFKEAETLGKEIRCLGVQAHLVQADFNPMRAGISKQVRDFAKKVFRKTSSVEVLINNAAIFYPTPFETISEKDWDAFMTINLKVPFFLAQVFGLRMQNQKEGKIINLADWTGERPPLRFIPYAVSKAGLVSVTKGLAKALAPHVQVLSIAPGPILPAEGATMKEQKLAAEKSLLKRYGNTKDIANAVRFLIEDSDFMTGSTLYVDGGASLV
ncbi:MAG: SDR family oxidoreductase [Candidatus Omnitrophica bacterium]|nr:SDR family oxidoreductase [Candidatus Omnitrophota bacterium]